MSPYPDPLATGEGSTPAERPILATSALATMLAPLNSTMIAVALPSIMAEFGASVAAAGWLVTGYLVGMAALQPVAGKLGDRFGRRRLILAGLGYFAVASLGATLATSLPMLIAFRVQQAIAGAIALPNGTALVREVLPPERRASGFGMVGAAVALAAAVGPPLGGLLVGAFGWRSIFFANVPMVAAALALGWWAVPRAAASRRTGPFDLLGAVLLSALLLGLAGTLTFGVRAVGTTAVVVGVPVLFVVAIVFVRRELGHPDPLLRPGLFIHRGFGAAAAAVCTSNLAMYSTLLTLPILLSHRPGASSAQAGAVLAALSIGSAVFAPLGGWLADRVGRRWATFVGCALLAAGLAPLAVSADLPLPSLLGVLGLAGVGTGLSSAPMQTAAVEAVAPSEAGAVSGLFSTSRYLGSIVGSIVLAALLGAGDDPAGYAALFAVVALASVLAVAASLGLRDWPDAGVAAARPVRA